MEVLFRDWHVVYICQGKGTKKFIKKEINEKLKFYKKHSFQGELPVLSPRDKTVCKES